MNTSWTLPVETVFNETTMEDDYILTFPEDLIEKLGWKEGDVLDWHQCPENHHIVVRKEVNFNEHA